MSADFHKCAGCSAIIGGEFAYCERCAQQGGEEAVDAIYDEAEAEGQVQERLALNLRRRYARAFAVMEVGAWSAKSLDYLFGIMLGSMPDIRNSYDEVRLDNRRLRFELKKLGLAYADCFSIELSPDSHEFVKRDGSRGVTVGNLWHEHGFFKTEELISARDLHSALSPIWAGIHGSEVADVKIIYDEHKAIKYTIKDAIKNYLSEDHKNKRLLRSKFWLPEGYREVDHELTEWALRSKIDWDNELAEPYQGYRYRLPYVAFVWEIKKDYLRRWCHGELIKLDMGDYKVVIQGKDIQKYDIKEKGGRLK